MRYPIGVQHFEQIRERNYVYIDKTELMYELVNDCRKVFLHRPRRFGKSLLVSTLKCYFEGRKELFKGLAIEKLEKEWKKYPVLHFDFSSIGSSSEIEEHLKYKLRDYEKEYGVDYIASSVNVRLTNVIAAANEATGIPPVVLIDEYDKLILGAFNDKEVQKKTRSILEAFFAPLKAADLRFLFLTGITKYSPTSIFSGLNNLEIISMRPQYAAICGITEEEMLSYFDEVIGEMAEERRWTKEECITKLRRYYNGYHFSHISPDIYNPFSLLQALKNHDIGPYWYASKPRLLFEQMRKLDVKPYELGEIKTYAPVFDVSIEDMLDISPLLYQSGYLTIKGYNKDRRQYTLDIPNNEIRLGLMQNMATYLSDKDGYNELKLALEMKMAFEKDDFDGAMKHLQTYLDTVPYTAEKDCEGYYQSLFYVLFSLMCRTMQVEARTAQSRVDVAVESPKFIYLIEIKLNKSAETAIDQIDLKHYADKFSLDTKPVKKVGVNFSSETRNITDWKVI